MDVRMVVTAVGGVPNGAKLVSLAAAPADEGDDDPNMEFTQENHKPIATAQVYINHPDKTADEDFEFEEGGVYNVSFTRISEVERKSSSLRPMRGSSETPTPGPTPNPSPSPSPAPHPNPIPNPTPPSTGGNKP